MELTQLSGEQLVTAEIQLRRYLPKSQQVYSCVFLGNRVTSDHRRVLVDQWPNFRIIICQPFQIEKGYFDTVFFATDEMILRETLLKSTAFDLSKFLYLGCDNCHTETLKAVALEANVSFRQLLPSFHMMMLEDISKLPSLDGTGLLLGSLNESHIDVINQTWKFSHGEDSMQFIGEMITNFPSCCVLDAKKQPVAWILIYATCAMGMLYTLPEHRGKGYAKVLVSTMSKRLHAQGYPVYCFIEEDNTVSCRLFKNLGFTENPSYRADWFQFNV